MANKIKLDVELQTQVKNTKALHKEVSRDGKFDQSGIKNSLKTLSKLENVTEMTEKEFKSFNDALQKVTNALYKHLLDNGKLSEAAIELKKRVDEQLTSIKNIKKNQVQNEKESQERKKSLTEKMGGKTIHAIDEKGALKKEKLSEEEVATKLAKGEKIGFQDDKGKIQEVTSESELGKAALAYNETIEKSQRLATSFENATNILIEHSTKLREQMAEDLGVKIEKAPSVEEKIETKEAPKEVKETKETPENEPQEAKTLGDQLKESLLQLLDALKGLNLTDQQKESVARHTKGAELALYAEDWKEFQTHFNAILKTFKTAASASDELSTSIKALTDKQGNLNQEINDLEKKKTDLKTKISTDSSGNTVLSKTGAEEFFKTSKDAEKVILKDGSKATRAEIIRIQEALNKHLQETGKEISKLTKEDVSKINSKLDEYGINVKDRNSLFAVNRYTKAENAEPARITKEIAATDKQIEGKTDELNNVKSRLEELNTAAKSGADSINALYIKINEMANAANKAITKELNKESEEKADKTPVAPPATAEDIKPIKEQTSGLGKAFKQFTIYNIALRAVKKALREAVATVKELDKELTEQAMVTGKTREQTYKLVKSYQDLAIQTGATTKEVAGVATEYMKQGKSTQEALILTEAAVSAAKVAGVSTADSVNYLTTALNGFQLAASDAMLVSDKFAAVAAASATDYDELAIALSKVASQANLAGMSIDYTTALLTKGLETTREAPETMGTALKTIIARMRELGDYGETLEGDTDINNVESQLAYVGIALRNTEGELRSTEEVLDELGKKWDTLDKNQQAAVAKALAGTRQQSRLIAMMSDYERVTELQEIAQRSAGATAAQAGVYLEGIEAALNNITVAWEKIVTAVTDADWIVSLLETAGTMLDNLGEALKDETRSIMILVPLVTIVLTTMMQKHEIQKKQNRAAIKEQKTKIATTLAEKEGALAKKKSYLLALKTLRGDKDITKQKAKQALLDNDKTNDAQAQYILTEAQKEELKDKVKLDAEIAAVEGEIKQEENEIRDLKLEQGKLSIEQAANAQGLLGTLGSVLNVLTPILTIMQLINVAQAAFLALKKKEPSAYAQSAAAAEGENAVKAKGMFAGIVSAFSSMGPWGVAAGIVLAIALVAALGVGIAAVAGAWNKKDDNADAERVNKLSNEIYKLNQKANAINQVTTSFDKLDNKIIKTNKDMEEMNSLLEQAADNLDDEIEEDEDIGYGVGVSEKEHYESLGSDKLKREFLDQVEKESREKMKKLREDQIAIFKGNSELLNENTTDAQIKKAQSSLYANAIYNLQEYIDTLKDAEELSSSDAASIEKLTQKMIEEADLSEAFDFADNEQSVKDLVNSIKSLETEVEGLDGKLETVSTAEILTSDDYGITQKAEAFRALKQEFGELSDEYKLLEQAYSEYAVFAEMGDDVLEMIDYLGMTIEDINDLQSSWSTLKKQGLNISESEYTDLITSELLPILAASGNDIGSTIDLVFGKYLSSAKDYEQTYNAIVNSFSQIIGQGMLNMGQSITKLKNTVNSFYEKATEWATMSDQEKSEFMSENAALFEGQTGVELLNALNTNNWKEMERILKEADGMQDQIEEKLKWIETELSIEEARIGEARNEAYIQQLKAWKNELEDSTNFFRADLQLLLDQEQAQLDIYRDYLEKQQEQLEESLDKRREAYEKYFEAINQQQEDEDYKEQSDKLVANLSKLASSTDMASKKQTKELEQQLADLEKERQDTLRQRAQDAVMESIDSEVEEISEKFDKLLNNEQLLLEALQTERNNPNFLTTLMASAREDGMTDLQLEEFANELNSAFGSSIDTSNVQEIMEQIQNNATINIGDQTFDLNSEDGNAVWETILAMLVKYGYGR